MLEPQHLYLNLVKTKLLICEYIYTVKPINIKVMALQVEKNILTQSKMLLLRKMLSYIKKMMQGGTATWNIRDTHMMDTLKRLMEFHGKQAKSIVWAHNTHVGDARYTDMAEAKMVNIGQLVREHAGDNNALLIGFGTYQGTVIAAKEWGENMERMHVPPAVDGSWDRLIHELSEGHDRLLLFGDDTKESISGKLLTEETRNKRRGQRAIGVVYNPEYEKYGNYVPSDLIRRYDAFLYIDKTHALHPLHMPDVKEDEDLPETYPTGL
jgi:erythromycin esterase